MRYEKIILEAGHGISFDISNRTNGELIIRTLSIEKANVDLPNYANPVIPEGYTHICGEWNNGFVIEKYSTGSQFVWIPVGSLRSNGTLDGRHFSTKFGRRNYWKNRFSNDEYYEPLNDELLMQLESVRKYGGFYISRYRISKATNDKPQSVKDAIPWVKINYYNAKKIAVSMEQSRDVTSHLTFGSEFDSMIDWFIQSGAKSYEEILKDSTDWNAKDFSEKAIRTGSREERCINNIYDFEENMNEWTQEQRGSFYYVIRGFLCNYYSIALRSYIGPYSECSNTGFRVTLYIK